LEQLAQLRGAEATVTGDDASQVRTGLGVTLIEQSL
jgi:hypothetical protein